jgi:hypothetical protein
MRGLKEPTKEVILYRKDFVIMDSENIFNPFDNADFPILLKVLSMNF